MEFQGKTLVIAEKSKVAKVFANAIGQREPIKWQKNHYESEHFIIEALEGHIFELYEIGDYTGNKSWNLEELPFVPHNFQFQFKLKQPSGNSRQKPKEIFGRIQKDLTVADQVIHLGDADNEGQILVEIVLFQANCRLPVYRIWTNANTEAAMWKGLQDLKPNTEYHSYAMEGYIRMYEDWLYGINGSRFVSLKIGNGNILGIGRVNTAITTAIYERDMEIKNFVSTAYYQAINKENIPIRHSKHFTEMEDCRAFCEQLNAQDAVVLEKTTKEREIAPKKLFNLDKIQSYMAKKYKVTPEETLRAMQKIYLDGYISYPRTDSEYLSGKEVKEVEAMIQFFQGQGFDLCMKQKKSIFDDKKVISHSALRPLKYPINPAASDIEKKVYDAILRRFLAVFCKEPCLVDRSVMKIQLGDDLLKIQGDIQKTLGWKKYEKIVSKDRVLPNYQKGDHFPVKFVPEERWTSPPKHYTTETLMYFLNNPFAKEDHQDDSDEYENIRKGAVIGTPATRSSIINNIIHYGYVTNANDVYQITERGIFVIEKMKELGIEMTKEKTVDFGVTQKKVGSGELSIIDALTQTMKELEKMCAGKDQEIEQLPSNDIGKCPICGNPIREFQKSFSCTRHDFIISKNNRYITSRKKKVTRKFVETLLTEGEAKLTGCKKADDSGTYDVYIALKKNPDGSIQMSNAFPELISHF